MQFGNPAMGRRIRYARPAASLSTAQRRYLAAARHLARFMDVQWRLGRFRFGAESVIGLAPVVGDVLSGVAGLYLLWTAYQLKMPARKLIPMALNTAFDVVIGLIPVAGDIADTIFKSHMRNLALIEEHVQRMTGERAS